MTTMDREQVGQLVMRIERHFLDDPGLVMTVPQAQHRFRQDEATCGAVLDFLVEAGVLITTGPGAYTRYFPRRSRASAA